MISISWFDILQILVCISGVILSTPRHISASILSYNTWYHLHTTTLVNINMFFPQSSFLFYESIKLLMRQCLMCLLTQPYEHFDLVKQGIINHLNQTTSVQRINKQGYLYLLGHHSHAGNGFIARNHIKTPLLEVTVWKHQLSYAKYHLRMRYLS